ncbi:hypothetical protein SVAN01_09531 [Stagonosporopsis vannaccii]|nr:hypothetical protein SVAN01_09531 [Stagonosporopsis vannaccii]
MRHPSQTFWPTAAPIDLAANDACRPAAVRDTPANDNAGPDLRQRPECEQAWSPGPHRAAVGSTSRLPSARTADAAWNRRRLRIEIPLCPPTTFGARRKAPPAAASRADVIALHCWTLISAAPDCWHYDGHSTSDLTLVLRDPEAPPDNDTEPAPVRQLAPHMKNIADGPYHGVEYRRALIPPAAHHTIGVTLMTGRTLRPGRSYRGCIQVQLSTEFAISFIRTRKACATALVLFEEYWFWKPQPLQ